MIENSGVLRIYRQGDDSVAGTVTTEAAYSSPT
jgi:hypothetical protein